MNDFLYTTCKSLIEESGVGGGATAERIARLAEVLCRLSVVEANRLRIVQVLDEYTGRRYGRALCRRGRVVKLGSGGAE